jgi:hypothetical protein
LAWAGGIVRLPMPGVVSCVQVKESAMKIALFCLEASRDDTVRDRQPKMHGLIPDRPSDLL